MITYMQFIDDDISLNVGEVSDKNTVHISMYQLGQELNEFSIILGESELIRLRDWLTESINTLKTEAP